ncbi:MAG: DUF2207 domain-containing protein, partial [Candidatus Gracilibacteria bacterium]
NYENYDYNSFDNNSPDSSSTYTENWEIKSYHSDITIAPNGKVDITENILADFTNESHKGMARTIPYQYSGDNGTEVDMEFVSATNEKGVSWDNEVYKTNGYLNIDMYEPARSMLSSEATFIVKYTANKVFGFFDEERATKENTFAHDEFYWNVNGTDWVVPIKESSATVHLPKPIAKEDLKTLCYTGSYESTIQNCEATLIDDQTIEFKTTQPLNAYENLTIVIAMPYGTIPPPPPPSAFEIIWKAAIRNSGIAFAVITFMVMFFLWYTHGRDDQSVSDTIVPLYTPPKDMAPAETGTIIDEKLDPKDITSTILDFAVKGFIKINEIEEKGLLFKSTDYELELLKQYSTTKEFEKTILSAIFPVNKAGEKTKISTLTNKFYAYIPLIEKSIMKQLVDNDYFASNPSSVRAIYKGIGGALMIGAIFGSELFTMILGMSFASVLGIGAAGLIIILFGNKMPRKTKKGTETYYQLKGLYEYINTAEKDRMKFQEKNNIMFEKLLPYAMAFGLISKWTKAFDGLIKTPPTWYHTNHSWGSNGFTMIYFADRLGAISGKFNQNITSSPGRGGSGGAWGGGSGFSGGFSGGGFGGGGGRGL